MGGFIWTLIGVLAYLCGVGAIRYYQSKKTEIYYDGLDVFIMVFYVLFNVRLSFLSYALWLFGLCFVLLFFALRSKRIAKLFFEGKYYFYKRGEK